MNIEISVNYGTWSAIKKNYFFYGRHKKNNFFIWQPKNHVLSDTFADVGRGPLSPIFFRIFALMHGRSMFFDNLALS